MGSSGGGGSSGAVSWPEYLQNTHRDWLNKGNTVLITKSITTVMNEALAANPYSNETAFDPSDDIDIILDSVDDLYAFANQIDVNAIWTEALNTASTTLSDTLIQESVDIHSVTLQDELDTVVLPKYRMGMRDLNMVNSSSYAIGEAILFSKKLFEVSKFGGELRLKQSEQRFSAANLLIDNVLKVHEYKRAVTAIRSEGYRLAIVASKEFVDGQSDIDTAEAKWNLDIFQSGANLIAATGGGTATTANKPNKVASALGGAMSGAAAGAMVGSAVPGIGTAVGAIVGGVIGLGASLFN